MRPRVNALKFRQWIKDWDELDFDPAEFRKKPSENIYLFSMKAEQLRSLSGVFRRKREAGAATGIQRGHERERSDKIRDFVRYGYPYSDMSKTRRESFDALSLRKPGWLPTAIVVNILTEGDVRRGQKVAKEDLTTFEEKDGRVEFCLPEKCNDEDWRPSECPPIEVIDGQHRLYAFDAEELPGTFELPVVAFVGLDMGWQAYLFWSINVSPKRINPSHAFDLYPLLRSQDWLEKFAESHVYREARSQELTELLYRHPESPWNSRINMLGERGRKHVTQAAWVNALSGTFLASGKSKVKSLFGSPISDAIGPLPWSRAQQAAFLIFLWQCIEKSVAGLKEGWLASVREEALKEPELGIDKGSDPAFSGPTTILNQEQGVRGVSFVANELFFVGAEDLNLTKWETDENLQSSTDDEDVSTALKSIKSQPFSKAIEELAGELATFDWRSADAPGLSDKERLIKRAFRGSGGYVALREELFKHLGASGASFSELATQSINKYRRK